MRVLFPIDGSESTYKAVEQGLRIIGTSKGASATFLVVLSKALREMPPEAREYLEFDDEDEVFIRDDEAKAVLDRAAQIANQQKFSKFKTLALEGRPKETIVRESAKHDLLVMHAMRRSEREDRRHGNAIEEIARRAACDVLLVRTD